MKPEIRLYFYFEFTSLSPDAMPISLGIISEEIANLDGLNKTTFEYLFGKIASNTHSKSFYAEFSDFDLNRCDDWVKENVVGKLKYYGTPEQDKMFLDSSVDEGTYFGSQNTDEIKTALSKWLSQFSEYNIQFVCDCGTFDFYHLLQLLAEWDYVYLDDQYLPTNIETFEMGMGKCTITVAKGLPKLPSNISPVPEDLNDLIATKKGISVREAFDMNREEYLFENLKGKEFTDKDFRDQLWGEKSEKHNALWDAKVIKAIYEKLK